MLKRIFNAALSWCREYQIGSYCIMWAMAGCFLGLGVFIGGCNKSTPVKPEVFVLRPGQSAVIMENVSVLARIPAQGDELYSGPVMIERGTVAIKPIVEQ